MASDIVAGEIFHGLIDGNGLSIRKIGDFKMTNIVFLEGNIGQNPESRNSRNGMTITNFTLATSEPVYKEGHLERDEKGYAVTKTEWHRIVCFKKQAENVAKHCEKGTRVIVTGSIHYTTWLDNKGQKRYGTEILARDIRFLGAFAKKEEEAPQVDLDDEIPF
ncbi:single-stranded DNA-binding protein [Bartonella sp. LJL80]